MSNTTATPLTLSDPGFLFRAPLGSTLPTMTVVGSVFTDAWPGAWINLGATVDGTEINYDLATSPVYAAEIFDAIKVATTGRTSGFAFELLNFTATNLKSVLNGATATVTGTTTTTLTKIAPPTPGLETRCMIGWESLDATVRCIGYQCLNTGAVKVTMKRAPGLASQPCVFQCEAVTSTQPIEYWFAGAARA